SITAAGQLQAAFIVQIAYAIFTWIIAGLVIKYQGYDMVDSGIQLKSGLLDYYVFFLVFLFGLRSADGAMTAIEWILLPPLCAHAPLSARTCALLGAICPTGATILDTAGTVNIGSTERIDGRTQGAMGESNQYAAYIILFIPGMIAAAVASKRFFWRMFWLGGA